MNIVITMAGFGSRFRDAGYDLPKYRIEARGRTLFAWSMVSLRHFFPVCERPIFIVRDDDGAGDFIAAEMARLAAPPPEIVALQHPTDGQATTALRAREIWDGERPLLIYNIDTHVDPAHLRPDMIRGEGWIPCVRVAGDHWSFVRLDAAGNAVEVREKKRISELASIGLYWFASAHLFEAAYQATYGANRPNALPERYVAPVYNASIDDGRQVTASEIPATAMIPLGTPEELDRFRGREIAFPTSLPVKT